MEIVKSQIGEKVHMTVFGGSHEKEIGVILDGLPLPKEAFQSEASLRTFLDFDEIQRELDRRAPGKSPLSTPRKEADKLILKSLDPLTFIIENTNIRSQDYKLTYPRPGHADITAHIKYKDTVNMSGGGPFSGRMTAPMVIAGSIAKQILKRLGINIAAHISSIGDVCDRRYESLTDFNKTAGNFPTISEVAGKKMQSLIIDAKNQNDSVGGTIEFVISGITAGIGGPMFDGLEGKLSNLLFGIPAVKGVEFGKGFDAAKLSGSQNNDEILPFDEISSNITGTINNIQDCNIRINTETNHCGGILGGISTGQPIIGRVAVKPTPSIGKPQNTINIKTNMPHILSTKGRHDPCIVPRAVPVVEAVLAFGILDKITAEDDPFAKYNCVSDSKTAGNTSSEDLSTDNSLEHLRDEIDALDSKIAPLLDQRMYLSKKVADAKKIKSREIHQQHRENEVINHVKSLCSKDFAYEVAKVYEKIFLVSKEIQKIQTDLSSDVYGLLGKTLSHSYSKEIHEALGKYSYNLIEKSEEDLYKFFTEKNFQALNVTIPYKKIAMDYCHKLSDIAKEIGAVNVVYKDKSNRLCGDNTDYYGFRYMAQRGNINFAGKTVAILGTGGASGVVLKAASDLGAKKIFLVTRNISNNKNIISSSKIDSKPVKVISYDRLYDLSGEINIIVNTTPVGTSPKLYASPIKIEQFTALSGVMDLIYNPGKTKLLQSASALNIPAVSGLSMLVAQAVMASKIFLGIETDEYSQALNCAGVISDPTIERLIKQIEKTKENIVLIGMPGSGKTTLGKSLAKKLNRSFMDLDEEIEKFAGMRISDIFSLYGEEYFRTLENSSVFKAATLDGYVIALGGGTLQNREIVNLLKQKGTLIYIKRDIENLSANGRPLSKDFTAIKALYQNRKAMYNESMDYAISNNGTIEEALEDILRIWRKK